MSEQKKTSILDSKAALPAAVALSLVVGGVGGFLAGDSGDVEDKVGNLSKQVSALSAQLQESKNKGVNAEGLSVAIVQGIDSYFEKEEKAKRKSKVGKFKNAPEEVEGDRWVYGNPNARFTLYEFADTQCGYCQRFHGTPKKIVDGSSGVVNWQYHPMAIIAQNSAYQAGAAECAGRQGNNRLYWTYLDGIFTEGKQYGEEGLVGLAGDLGFDEEEFRTCVNSNEISSYIANMNQKARGEGVTGTPTSYLMDNKTGDKKVISGAQPAGAFIGAMKTMLQDEKNKADQQEG